VRRLLQQDMRALPGVNVSPAFSGANAVDQPGSHRASRCRIASRAVLRRAHFLRPDMRESRGARGRAGLRRPRWDNAPRDVRRQYARGAACATRPDSGIQPGGSIRRFPVSRPVCSGVATAGWQSRGSRAPPARYL
jgi:hypothetical protein